MRFTPEYPPYCDEHHHHKPEFHFDIRSDWNQDNQFAPDYIRNKPNVILNINGVEAKNGRVDLKPSDIGISAIKNDDIYKIMKDIFEV